MKKAMSTILGSLLVVMLVFTTLSYHVNAAWTPDGVYVGGQNVGGGGYWKTTEDGEVVSGTSEDYNVKYENGNLTLKNATIKQATSYNWDNSGNCDSAAIYVSDGNLTIHLVGANTIVGTDNNNASSYGIYVFGNLTIDGQGSLNVTSGKAGDNEGSVSAAVFAKVMNLKGCSIEAVGNIGNASYGLYTYYRYGMDDRISIKNAQITAEGKTRAVYSAGTVDTVGQVFYTVIYKSCETKISFDGVEDTATEWTNGTNDSYKKYGHRYDELMEDSKKFSVVNGHVWTEKAEDAYKVSDATYEKPAVYKKSCSVCGTTHESDTFTHGQVLVREENKNTGNQTPASTPEQTVNQTTNQVPKTGDHVNVVVWLSLCVMCGVVMIIETKKRKEN